MDTSIAVLGTSIALYNFALPWFRSMKPGKDEEVLKHLTMDFSMTPIRLMLAYLSFPILKQCFISGSSWTENDIQASHSAWILLSLGYLFDMVTTKPDLMGFVHHSIAFGSTAFSIFAMSDVTGTAFWHRYQSAELFFAISAGGMVGTALRVAYLFASLHGHEVPRRHQLIVTSLTWCLTAIISMGWAFKILYIHQTAPLFWNLFGPIGVLFVLAALSVIFAVQYRWIFMWGAKADRLTEKAGHARNINGTLRRIPLRSVVAGLSIGMVDFGRLYVQLLRAV
jgi:hypothetical protein